MRKQIALSAAAVVAFAALAAGGFTLAGLTDTEAGPGASAQAGTLDLVDTNGPATGTSANQTFTNLVPVTPPAGGVYQASPYFWSSKLRNAGSLAGALSWRVVNVQNRENGCGEPESSAGDVTCISTGTGQNTQGELGAQLRVVLSVLDANCGGPPVVVSDSITAAGNSQFRSLAAPGGNPVGLGQNETRCVRADLFFVDRADNNLAQSDSTRLAFQFRLNQS